MVRMAGVQPLSTATWRIAQGCRLSGELFVCAFDPMVRHLHEVLRTRKAGVSRPCADDVAVLLRNVRFLATPKPVFDAAERFVGFEADEVRRVVLIGARPGMQRAEVAGMLALVSEA